VKAVVIILNTCQYLATVTSKAQSRDRNSETALTVSIAIKCYVRASVIDGVIRFLATKRETAKCVETRVSVCLRSEIPNRQRNSSIRANIDVNVLK